MRRSVTSLYQSYKWSRCRDFTTHHVAVTRSVNLTLYCKENSQFDALLRITLLWLYYITLLWLYYTSRCCDEISQFDALLQREQSIRRFITYHVVVTLLYYIAVTLLHITLLWRDQSIWRFIAKRTINSTLYYISRCRDSITYHVAVTKSINSTLYYISHCCDEISQLNALLYFCQWLLRRFFDLVDLKSLFINCTLVVSSTIRSFDTNI